MCGIAGFHVFGDYEVPNVNLFADKLLDGIESRGRDATGYGWVCDDGSCLVQKASLKASEFIKARKPLPPNVRTVVLHTRYATNGHHAFPENNHPTVAGSVVSVHNGVIWNDNELFKRVDTERLGEVDSEVVPHLVNHYGMDNIDRFMEDIEGSFALAFFDAENPGNLRLIRGYSSPLYVYLTDKLVVWASTYLTIRNAWSAVFGTPPAYKNVEELREGTAIAYDRWGESREESFTFEPAGAWQSRYTSGAACNIPMLTAAAQSVLADGDTEYSINGQTWMTRCGLCDLYCDGDDLDYLDEMWICQDCQTYVYNKAWDKLEQVAERLADEAMSEDDDDERVTIPDEDVEVVDAPEPTVLTA